MAIVFAKFLLVLAAWVTLSHSHATSAMPDGDVRHVAVSVLRPDGTPVAGVPVFVRTDQYTAMRTDINGIASAEVFVPAGMAFVTAAVSWTIAQQEMFPNEHALGALDWLREYKVQRVNHGPHRTVPLPASGDIRIQFLERPAVTLTGRVVDSEGTGVNANILNPDGSVLLVTRLADSGHFAVHGVAVAPHAELFIVSEDGRIVPYSVAPTDVDRDLGDIVLTDEPSAKVGRVLVRVLSAENPITAVASPNGVTLVSEDGSRIYSGFVSGTDGMIYKSFNERVPRELPVGSYYAIPGAFVGWDWQVRVLDAIVAGDHDVTRTIDRLLVVENELTEITINAGSVTPALEKVLSPDR